ncbi:M48 family metalloprotease [candidate division KSB1 bacterium]|nr:M48 family metalloprotease [candidate division KSB1 bacterium]
MLVISCFLSLLPLYSYWVTPFFLVLRKDVRTAEQSIKNWVNTKYPGLNKIYVYNREPVNAFAIGLFGRSRRILIHQKLVDALPQEQVQAILAHEIAHLQNRHLYLSYLIHVAGLLAISSAMRPLYIADFSSEALRLLTIVLTSAGLAGIFFAFLPALVMRRLEIKADRQAAKTVGVETYSAALQALFRLSERADKGGDLYHPPLKKRLAALQNI